MSTNVLELCESYGGGVRRYVDYLNEYVDTNEFNLITLVSSKRSKNIPKNYFVLDEMSMITKRPHSIFFCIKQINKYVKRNNIKIIHAQSTIAGILAAVYHYTYNSKIPIIYTPHAYYSEVKRGKFKDVIIRFVEKQMNKAFKKILHVSLDENKFALDNRLVSATKSTVIYNGVRQAQKVDAKIFIDELNFVNVARCDYQKNPELFIEIASKIVKDRPKSTFTWVGDGPLIEECNQLVTDKHLAQNIKFVGYQDNPYEYLEQANVYMSTSRYEGLPFSVVEALSVKLPLMLTDVIGHRELVNGNGILLQEQQISNANYIRQTVQQIAQNMNDYSQASYQMFEKNYTIEVMISKVQKLYESVL